MSTHYRRQVGVMRQRRRLHGEKTQCHPLQGQPASFETVSRTSFLMPLPGDHLHSRRVLAGRQRQATVAKPDLDRRIPGRQVVVAVVGSDEDLHARLVVEQGFQQAGLFGEEPEALVQPDEADEVQLEAQAQVQVPVQGGRRRMHETYFQLADLAALARPHLLGLLPEPVLQ